jgi:hypothetical protein
MTRAEKRQRNIALQLVAVTLATCVVSVVLMFIPGSTVNHQGTYAVQVATTIFAFMMLSLRAPPLAIAFIAVQTITVATLYAFTQPHDVRLWPMQIVCAAAAASLFGYTFHPTIMERGADAERFIGHLRSDGCRREVRHPGSFAPLSVGGSIWRWLDRPRPLRARRLGTGFPPDWQPEKHNCTEGRCPHEFPAIREKYREFRIRSAWW